MSERICFFLKLDTIFLISFNFVFQIMINQLDLFSFILLLFASLLSYLKLFSKEFQLKG